VAWSCRTVRVRMGRWEGGGVVHRWQGPSALEREGGGGDGDVAWSRRTLRVRMGEVRRSWRRCREGWDAGDDADASDAFGLVGWW
jgi:hypothetical protein